MRILLCFVGLCAVTVGLLTWRVVSVGTETDAVAASSPLRASHWPGTAQPRSTDADDEQAAAPAPSPAPYRGRGAALAATPEPAPLPVPPVDPPVNSPVQTPKENSTARTAPDVAVAGTVHWSGAAVDRDALRRLELARQTLAVDPHHPRALADALQALEALRRWSEAADVAERLLELTADPALRLRYAELLIRNQRWAPALRPLERCVETVPDDAVAWKYLAAARHALGHLQDALAAWSRVIELAPNTPGAFAHRGELHLTLRDWQAAHDDLREACRRDPDDARSALNLSRAMWHLGRQHEARLLVLDILSEQPEHVPAMNRLAELAWLSYRMGEMRTDLDMTITWCERSLAIDPVQPTTEALLRAARAALEE